METPGTFNDNMKYKKNQFVGHFKRKFIEGGKLT